MRLWLVAFLMLAGVLLAGRSATAQTSAQLSTVMLSPDDVPGFTIYQEGPLETDVSIPAAYQRTLSASADSGVGPAALSIDLLTPNDSLTVLHQLIDKGTGLTSFASYPGFQLTGPLGVGDDDQSATWQGRDGRSDAGLTYYGDEFSVGQIVASLIYNAPSDSADPTAVGTYALQQAQKLLDSGLVQTQPLAPIPSAPAPALVPVPSQPPVSTFAGPITVSASLSTQTCTGLTVSIFATVTDANGNGVSGASVSGYVQYRTTGHGFPFPPTDSSGSTSTPVSTGRPRGGYTVVWTVTATANGYSATTTTTCFAP